MFIVKEKKALAKEIFDGRNSEWFSNLSGTSKDNEYDHLPKKYGFSDQCPDWMRKKYRSDSGYYNFIYINVADFKNWFLKYRPDKDAGWVTTYDRWRIENKGYVPDYIEHYLSEEDNINDMHFVEVSNEYDCSLWLYNYLNENEIPNDATIWYCFDC